MSEDEWLANIKPGDPVFATMRHGEGFTSLVVSRLTKARIFVRPADASYEVEYRRSDGRSIGSGSWSHSFLAQATPERLKAHEHRERKIAAMHRLRAVQWGSVPLATLEQIIALLPEPKP